MGILKIDCNKPHHAPRYDYGYGFPDWAGKHEDQLDDYDRTDILSFAENEGWRRGNNSVTQGVAPEEYARQPFHPDFMKGKPYKLWHKSVQEGIQYRHSENWLMEHVFPHFSAYAIDDLRTFLVDHGFTGECMLADAPEGTETPTDWLLGNPYHQSLAADDENRSLRGYYYVPLPTGQFFRFTYET